MIDRSARIRKAIINKGLSFAELEKLTGVSHSALQRYASGETKKIPVDVIEKIASVTGVTARYLMGWDEDESSLDEKDIPEHFEKYIELIKRYEKLNEHNRNLVDELINSLSRE